MRTTRVSFVAVAVFLIIPIDSAFGQAIIQHLGNTNPTNEGFFFVSPPGASVAPVTNDLGMNAWTTTLTPGGTMLYGQSLTSQQQARLSGANWRISATLRVVQSSGSSTDGNIVAAFFTGSQDFELHFGSNTNGDPLVKAGFSSAAFVLNGAGSTYHNYQLVYNAASGTADLWVDGVKRINSITGNQNSGSPAFYWGILQTGIYAYQANWNLLSLTVPPALNITLNGQRNPVINFHTSFGEQYSIEYSPDLSPGSWTNLPNGSISGDGNDAQVTDTNVTMSVNRFYRLKLSP